MNYLIHSSIKRSLYFHSLKGVQFVRYFTYSSDCWTSVRDKKFFPLHFSQFSNLRGHMQQFSTELEKNNSDTDVDEQTTPHTITIMDGNTKNVLANREVLLTEQEENILKTLSDIVKSHQLKTTVRAAGGWVRDKLLGRKTKDFDVAVDDMTGQEFAQHVTDYLKEHGEKAHTVAVIRANPEQSKHLEAATTRIHGLPIDFVNLRCEEYTTNSRIPTMQFGTPLEDALRRDFTINAMFFNVNQGVIEDFTGRGYDDLQHGLLRTPLEPLQTLLDDPLRVLRAVRFASRYAFALVSDLWDAMQDKVVQEALQSKVSRERIGAELSGMLSGPRPIGSIWLMYETQLLPIVFESPKIIGYINQEGISTVTQEVQAPSSIHAFAVGVHLVESLNVLWSLPIFHHLIQSKHEPDVSTATATATSEQPVVESTMPPASKRSRTVEVIAASTLSTKHESPDGKHSEIERRHSIHEAEVTLKQLHTSTDHSSQLSDSVLDSDTKGNLILSALLWEFRNLLVQDEAKGKRQLPYAAGVLKCRLKWSAKRGEDVTSITTAAQTMLNVLPEIAKATDTKGNNTEIQDSVKLGLGRCLRQCGPLWTTAFQLAVCVHAAEDIIDHHSAIQTALTERATNPARSKIAESAQVLAVIPRAITDWHLDNVWKLKPLINGKDLIKMGARPGPQLSNLLAAQIDWLILHPMANLDECKVFMQTQVDTKK